ncbi:MAG: acyl carrier protein phosphodiesterase [Saprospiraceae bacterium]
MNYLAHVYLSCQDKDLLIGNFLTDFLTTKDIKNQSASILKGIELHKSIDKFTDQHVEVRACNTILSKTQGKYAPVISDILFDYFLTKHWNQFSSESIDVFTKRVYLILEQNKYSFPEKLRDKLTLMIFDDFLMSCKNEERLVQTFLRLKRRAKFDNHFETIHLDLKKNYAKLDGHFLSFFPDLIHHVNKFCNC